jgi:hypothetical protein
LGGVRVIVGEEVSSAEGHVLGLFLHERVPPGLSVEETAERIRSQGGLVLAPHPRALLCRDSLSESALRRLMPWLDAVEVCNAQNPLWWEDAWARRFAQRYGLPAFVGADAHLRGYLAAAYQVLPAFDGPAGFLAALRQATLHPGRFGLGYVGLMAVHHVWERVFQRPFPGCGGNQTDRRSDGTHGASAPAARAGPRGAVRV